MGIRYLIPTHTHTHTHTYTHTHTHHTHTHTQTHTHTHTRMHACMHAHTQTHARKNAHVHTKQEKCMTNQSITSFSVYLKHFQFPHMYSTACWSLAMGVQNLSVSHKPRVVGFSIMVAIACVIYRHNRTSRHFTSYCMSLCLFGECHYFLPPSIKHIRCMHSLQVQSVSQFKKTVYSWSTLANCISVCV